MANSIDLGKITASVTVGSVTTGDAGSSASVTNSGTTQDAIFNFTIPRGNVGPQGQQGPQGPQGPMGPSGYSGAAEDLEVVQVSGNSATAVMSQKAVTDEIMTPPQSWDLSYGGDFTWELGTIHDDDGKAHVSSSYYHLYIPVSHLKGWKVKLKAQATANAYYTLLKDVGFAYISKGLDISSYYCEGYSTSIIIPAGEEVTFIIPDDCNYIYISCGQISGVVLLPQSNSYCTNKWGDVVQTTGDSTHTVMSQKAVTDEITTSTTETIVFSGLTTLSRHGYLLPKGNLCIKIKLPTGTTSTATKSTLTAFEVQIAGNIVYNKNKSEYQSLNFPLELEFEYDSDGEQQIAILERVNGSCELEIKGVKCNFEDINNLTQKLQLPYYNKSFLYFANSTTNTHHSYKLPNGYLHIKLTLSAGTTAVQPSQTLNGFHVVINGENLLQVAENQIASLPKPYVFEFDTNNYDTNTLDIYERLNGMCTIEISSRKSVVDRVEYLEREIDTLTRKNNKYSNSVSGVSQESLDKKGLKWSIGVESSGIARLKEAYQEYTSGTAWADYRICTYEDGSPIVESGKMFFCFNARTAANGRGIYSLDINTAQFKHVGEIVGFKDDGSWMEASANHIMFNRMDGYWYVYNHTGNPHNLFYSKCVNDPRFGINYVTFSALDYAQKTSGDEDNFVYYDKDVSKWVLVYSKQSTKICKQTSNYPDRGFGNAIVSSLTTLTGPTVTKVGGVRYIVAGYGSSASNDAYKVLNIDTLQAIGELNLDYPTGGWRGWGTLIPIPEDEKTKYILMTFDRMLSSDYHQWTYGNLYMYEADERNDGHEYDIIRGSVVLESNATQTYSPTQLHFKRQFTYRKQFDDNIKTGGVNLKNNIFAENGNPYPILAGSNLNYRLFEGAIFIQEAGIFEILGGAHLVRSEYVMDLTDMNNGEVRYIKLFDNDNVYVTIRVLRYNDQYQIFNNDVSIAGPGLTYFTKIRFGFAGTNVIISYI